tara:strand:- start:1566 stop:2198 length:633 start_codon:yes stop_codon:yes gene_type:complete
MGSEGKQLIFLIVGILMLKIVSAYNFSPSEIMQNEWFVFAGVFLIIFALVYMALINFFTKMNRKKYYWGEDDSFLQNRPIIIIISAIIALFSAAAFIQQDLISSFFGEAVAMWVFLLMSIVMIILTIPFYKVLKKNVGGTLAILIFLIGIWLIMKFGFNPYDLNILPAFDIPLSYYEFYNFFTETSTIVVLSIITIVFLLIKYSIKKRNV